MTKTLVAYATRWGTTAETSEAIAKVLREKHAISVDVVDIKKQKNIDIEPYSSIILGVSVAIFRWAKEGKKFLKKHDFNGKKLFVFVSSGRCGEAMEKNDQEEYKKRQKQYIDDPIKKLKLHLTSRKAFGGVYQEKDTRNWDVIRAWADEVGTLIAA